MKRRMIPWTASQKDLADRIAAELKPLLRLAGDPSPRFFWEPVVPGVRLIRIFVIAKFFKKMNYHERVRYLEVLAMAYLYKDEIIQSILIPLEDVREIRKYERTSS